MAPRIHIKDIVHRSEQGCPRRTAPRPPRNRCVHKGEIIGRRFKGRHAILLGRPFDFAAHVKDVRRRFDAAAHSEWRDTGYRTTAIVDRRANIIGNRIGVDADRTNFSNGRADFGFKAVIGRVLLEILEHRKVIFLCARSRIENKIVKPVCKTGQREAHPANIAANIGFKAKAFFRGESGIADFKGLGRNMRTIGEQLLSRWCTFGARQVHPDAHIFFKVVMQTASDREGVEAPVDRNIRCRYAGMLKARSRFQAKLAKGEFLQREDTDLFGIVARNKGLGADRIEIANIHLSANYAAPAILIGLDQLQPALKAFDKEQGTNLIAFKFGMGVIGIAEPHANALKEAAAGDNLAAQINADLLEIDGDWAFFLFALFFVFILTFFVVVFGTGACRNTIIGVEEADGRANAAPAIDPG